MQLTINRMLYSNQGVIGKLYIDSDFECYTLENPWFNNLENVSCIPETFYQMEPWKSPKFGQCFRLLEVPNRTNILIHVGNIQEDTKGCILVGESLGFLNENLAVLNSRKALDKLKEKVNKRCKFIVQQRIEGLTF